MSTMLREGRAQRASSSDLQLGGVARAGTPRAACRKEGGGEGQPERVLMKNYQGASRPHKGSREGRGSTSGAA
jgi:hypothetical protein